MKRPFTTSVRPELVEGLSFSGSAKKKGSPSTCSGRTVLLSVLLALATPAFADSNRPPAYWADRQLPDRQQEARAVALMEELRCLVCQGQSIADSDAEIAGDMRDLVRRRIAAGERPSAVRAWLVERYGNWVSYRPPTAPIAWPLWLAPLLLLAAGVAIARSRLKRRRAP